MRNEVQRVVSSIAIPPGETLRETLDALDLSQTELARRTGRPIKTINEIVQGKARITADTAIQLERVLGAPAAFWNNLETQYQETLARHRADEALEDEEEELGRFPYAEMAALGWVPKTQVRRKKVEALISFFSVASLRVVVDVEQTTFRVGKKQKVSPESIAAWLRRGELLAESIETSPYDESTLRASIETFRSMTRQAPKDFERRLVRTCADCGIALVFVPHLKRTYANGAARWVSADRAIVQLSLRYRYSDVFWFTFFHEIGHLLLHGRRRVFVDTDATKNDAREHEANDFAASSLISRDRYKVFVSQGVFSANAVTSLAQELDIPPGVVVGRLQHEGLIGFNQLTSLRTKFTWREKNA